MGKHDPKYKAEKSARIKEQWKNPQRRERFSASIKKTLATPEHKALASQRSKETRTPAVRQAISDKMIGRPKSLSTRKLMSENHNTSEEYRKKLSQVASETNTRYADVNSERLKKLWQETPEKMIGKHGDGYVEKEMSSLERKVWEIIEPLGFHYEPRFYRVEGINILPDFVYRDLVIEVQGEYWHTRQQTQERERLLMLLGKKVLFVWGKELGKIHMHDTKERILLWIGENS